MSRGLAGPVGASAELILVLLLLLSPLPNGCLLEGPGDARFQTLLDGGIFIVFLLVLVEARLLGRPFSRPAAWLPIALLVAYVLLQTLPLPIGVLRTISPGAATLAEASVIERPTWGTLSVTPQLTLLEALRFGACLAALFVVVNRFRTMRDCARLAVWITVVGVAMTILAFVQRTFAPPFTLLWIWPLERWGTPFGPYINKNHFAGLAEIALGASLALLLRNTHRILARTEGWSPGVRLSELFGREFHRVLLPFAAFALIGAGLVASLSRGGWIAMGVSILVLLGWLIFAKRVTWAWKAGVLLILAVVVVTAVVGPGNIENRFTVQGRAVNRPRIWADSVDLWRDYPVFGSGAGSFLYAFQAYHSFPDKRLATHAEMDWLQMLTGLGLVGFAMIVWAAVVFVRRLRAGLRSAEDVESQEDWMARSLFVGGILTGVLSLVLHGFLDVNLQIPANAFHFAVLGGLALAAVSATPETPGRLYVDGDTAGEETDR